MSGRGFVSLLGKPGDPLVSGAMWNAFADAIRDAGRVVLPADTPQVDAATRAEKLRRRRDAV